MFAKTVKNNKSYVIGLTGGIATGKTTAINYIKQKNIKVIDSDLIVKELWRNNLELNQKAIELFNLKSLEMVDKKELKQLVFNDQDKLKLLNNLVHPYVLREIERLVNLYRDEKYIIIDMPLLFEIKYEKVDFKVLLHTTENQQITRLIKRDNISIEQAQLIISKQMKSNLKLLMADYVIYNNGSIEELYKNIDIFLKEWENEIK